MILFEELPTPIGVLTLAADAEGLRHIGFPREKYPANREGWRRAQADESPILRKARGQLREYFAGARHAFDLPLAPRGTPFQCEVWRMLATIPYGATWTYRDLAQAIGKPAAMRAVGAANGRNPIPIVLPCHRVIGADGSLTGFGGGLETKATLLRLEGALPQAEVATPDLFGPAG